MSSTRTNSADEIESADAINKYRESKKLPPLILDAELSEMVDLLNHQRADGVPLKKQDQLEDRLKKIPLAVTGDELTISFPKCDNPGKAMTSFFIDSPDHAEILRSNYTHIGISIIQKKDRIWGVQFPVKKVTEEDSIGMTPDLRNQIQRELLNVLNSFRQEYKMPVLRFNQETSDMFNPQCTKYVRGKIDKLLDDVDDLLDKIDPPVRVLSMRLKKCDDALLEILRHYSMLKHHKFLKSEFEELGISVDSYQMKVGVILSLVGGPEDDSDKKSDE